MNPILTSALRLSASLVLAGMTIAAADPALAARSADAHPQTAVRVSDLDLNTTAGRAVAARRVHIAAQHVCVSGDRKSDQACIEDVVLQGRKAVADRMASQVAAR